MNRINAYSNRPSNEAFTKYPVWADEHWMMFETTTKVIKIKRDDWSLGFVYVVEYGDMVKIGITCDPYDRFTSVYNPAKKLGLKPGRVFISPAHRQYLKTERALHRHFAECRIPNTELFRIRFSEKIPEIMCMALDCQGGLINNYE